MNLHETVIQRNAAFAERGFTPGLRMMPILKTIVIGCVDPRVDPTLVLGTEPGEVAAIRNVGGRVTPSTLKELEMLRKVTQAAGGDIAPGWELVVVQHTDCGIARIAGETAMMSDYLGVAADQLPDKSVSDPTAAVVVDVEVLRAQPWLAGVRISGLVYDTESGTVEDVVTA